MVAKPSAVLTALDNLRPIERPSWPEVRVVTVRMREGLHSRLKDVAMTQGVSMNVLCLASLEAALKELEVKALAQEAG